MDGETGLEDAVLHPADKELLARRGAGKTADVRALVGLAGKAHARNDGDVVLQALPAGVVVTAPGLRVFLDPGTAAAADHIGTCVGVVLLYGLVAETAHNGAHQGL